MTTAELAPPDSKAERAPRPNSIDAFCRELGVSKQTYYNFSEEAKPHHLRVGRRVVLTESVAEWMARMAKAGRVCTATQKTSVAA